MPLPAVAIAAGIARAAATASTRHPVAQLVSGGGRGAGHLPYLTVKLEQGGRGLQRKARRIANQIHRASYRAVNATGKEIRIRAEAEMRATLNVPQTRLRKRRRIYRATPSEKTPTYTILWFRDAPLVPQALKGARFRPSRKAKPGALWTEGTLTIRTYGKLQKLRVLRKGYAPQTSIYYLFNADGAVTRPVYGTWIPAKRLRGLRQLQRRVPRLFAKAFEREKRRARVR